jgi:excinuclease ABC subunit C
VPVKAGFSPGKPVALPRRPVFSALLKQLYIDQHYVPRSILVPADFDDREALAALLTERTGHRIEIAVPQRGEKRSLVDLAGQNAKQSYIQRFRVLEPSRKAIQEALADALMLPELPRRIECFDISHIQGAETVASLVVWEDGKMNKQAYRKFKVMTVAGVDDFASMREVVTRRYRRLQKDEASPCLRSSSSMADSASFTPPPKLSNPWASPRSRWPPSPNAKRSSTSTATKRSRWSSTAARRCCIWSSSSATRATASPSATIASAGPCATATRNCCNIPGVGPQTRQRLLTHFGSLRDVQQATAESLAAVVPASKTAEAIWRHFHGSASPRAWLLFGLLAGMGIENKHSTVFFLVALCSACCSARSGAFSGRRAAPPESPADSVRPAQPPLAMGPPLPHL